MQLCSPSVCRTFTVIFCKASRRAGHFAFGTDFPEIFFLHQVRLGIVSMWITGSTLPCWKIPSFTLQLLTENVIKHNTINSDNPMTIYLSTSDDKKKLVVSNEIRLKQNVVKSGTGLKNLSTRCKLVSDQDISIENDSKCFTVKIPLLK